MPNAYEYARADGTPEWKGRTRDEGTFRDDIFDVLRFHRGGGFVITDRTTGAHGPAQRLNEIPDRVLNQMHDHPELRVFEIRSVSDAFAIVVRRDHVELDDAGRRIVQHEEDKIGLPYRLGYVPPSGFADCSGLTLWSHQLENVTLPHKAAWQHDLFQSNKPGYLTIGRAQVQRGDLIFHWYDEHVSVYYGDYHGIESVIDTEPSDTGAPSGWPKAMLGTGVQIRPMIGNYYCAWPHVTGIGRIVSINGRP